MTPEEFEGKLRLCGITAGSRVLAAVSGGADSICLLWLLNAVRETYPLSVVCAHAEHGIRGSASIADMEYVRKLCRDWSVEYHCKHLNISTKRKKGSIEETARDLRYEFLRECMRETGCTCILTAHHAADQAETVLMRASRGTDIRGLRAMAYRNGDLARPFLDTDPEDLRCTLRAHGISWQEDETNLNAAYSRNRIRLTVLPALEQAAPGTRRALCRLASAAERDESYFAERLEELGLFNMIGLADGMALPVGPFAGLHPSLVSRAVARLLLAAGFQPDACTIQNALKMIGSGEDGTVNLQHDGILMCGKRYLCAVYPHRRIGETALYEGENSTAFGIFTLRVAQENSACDGKTCQLIPAQFAEGLTVGSRLAGERMVPFGRSCDAEIRKLISDSGIDQGLRRSVPVVRSDGQAIWLPGIRAGEKCRIRSEKAWMIKYHGLPRIKATTIEEERQ